MDRGPTRTGDSWGVILPRKVLELLENEEGAGTETVSNARFIAAPDADLADIQAMFAYLASKRERKSVYQTLSG